MSDNQVDELSDTMAQLNMEEHPAEKVFTAPELMGIILEYQLGFAIPTKEEVQEADRDFVRLRHQQRRNPWERHRFEYAGKGMNAYRKALTQYALLNKQMWNQMKNLSES